METFDESEWDEFKSLPAQLAVSTSSTELVTASPQPPCENSPIAEPVPQSTAPDTSQHEVDAQRPEEDQVDFPSPGAMMKAQIIVGGLASPTHDSSIEPVERAHELAAPGTVGSPQTVAPPQDTGNYPLDGSSHNIKLNSVVAGTDHGHADALGVDLLDLSLSAPGEAGTGMSSFGSIMPSVHVADAIMAKTEVAPVTLLDLSREDSDSKGDIAMFLGGTQGAERAREASEADWTASEEVESTAATANSQPPLPASLPNRAEGCDANSHKREPRSERPDGVSMGLRRKDDAMGGASAAEQGSVSWAKKAHGIWHRDTDEPPNTAPAEEADGDWVDLALEQSLSAGVHGGEAAEVKCDATAVAAEDTAHSGDDAETVSTRQADRQEEWNCEAAFTEAETEREGVVGSQTTDHGSRAGEQEDNIKEEPPSSSDKGGTGKKDVESGQGVNEESSGEAEMCPVDREEQKEELLPTGTDGDEQLTVTLESDGDLVAKHVSSEATFEAAFGSVTESREDPPLDNSEPDLKPGLSLRSEEGDQTKEASAASKLDWGNFGSAGSLALGQGLTSNNTGKLKSGVVEKTEAHPDVAAAEAWPRADRQEGETFARRDEGNTEEDEWSAFEIPPIPQLTKEQTPAIPLPATEDSSKCSNVKRVTLLSVLPVETEELPFPAPPDSPHVGHAGDEAKDANSDDWGAFEEVPRRPVHEEESPLPPPSPKNLRDNDESTGEKKDWGAFGEEPVSGLTSTDDATYSKEPEAARTKAAGGDAVAVEEETTGALEVGGGDGEEADSEQEEWSEFGDFEEAPTSEQEVQSRQDGSPLISDKSARDVAPAIGELAKAVATSKADSDWNAFEQGVKGDKPAAAHVMPAPVDSKTQGTMGATANLPGSEQALAAMVALFDKIFGGCGGAAITRGSLAGGGTAEDMYVDALVDFASLLRHAQPSRGPHGGLRKWAKSCILRGIRPVPDALALEDTDEEVQVGGGGRETIPAAASDPAAAVESAVEPGVKSAVESAGSSDIESTAPVIPSLPGPAKPVLTVTSTNTPPPHTLPLKEDVDNTPQTRDEDIAITRVAEITDFAAFPAPSEPPSFGGANFDTDHFTPDIPQAPPRVPSPPGFPRGKLDAEQPAVGSAPSSESSGSERTGDGTCNSGTDSGTDRAAVAVDAVVSTSMEETGTGGEDEAEWGDDPFDDFQCAPPMSPPPPPPSFADGPAVCIGDATWSPPAEKPATATPATETPTWSLDLFMAAPAKTTGGSAAGVKGALVPGTGGSSGGERSDGIDADGGKSLDLISQALAGYGITNSPSRESQRGKTVPNDTSSFPLSRDGLPGMGVSSGDVVQVDKEGVASVEVSDLLRATQLRGRGHKGSRSPPLETLSTTAQSRLAALPDLSFMLSDRLRFPMRATVPLST